MKPATILGSALASCALLALVALPVQDANSGKPKAPAAAKPPGQTTPTAKQDAKPGAKPGAKPAAKPVAKPAVEPAAAPAAQDAAAADRAPGAAITKRYEEAMTPGEQHAWLAKLAGKWKTSAKLLTEPDAPAVEMVGSSEFKMLMDGRFLIESHDAGGSLGAFRGMGIMGFNNVTSKYERVWFDTTSTAMVKSEGEFVEAGNNIRWTDQRSDPRSNRVREVQSKLTIDSDDAFTFLMIDNLNGKMFTAVEVHYRRE